MDKQVGSPDAVAAVWAVAEAVASDAEALADAWVMADTAIWLWPAAASLQAGNRKKRVG